MGIHIAVIEPGRDPYLKEVEPEDREGLESSYLGAFQREVGGNVEAYNVLWGDQPSLYVNEESLLNGSTAQRLTGLSTLPLRWRKSAIYPRWTTRA